MNLSGLLLELGLVARSWDEDTPIDSSPQKTEACWLEEVVDIILTL